MGLLIFIVDLFIDRQLNVQWIQVEREREKPDLCQEWKNYSLWLTYHCTNHWATTNMCHQNPVRSWLVTHLHQEKGHAALAELDTGVILLETYFCLGFVVQCFVHRYSRHRSSDWSQICLFFLIPSSLLGHCLLNIRLITMGYVNHCYTRSYETWYRKMS